MTRHGVAPSDHPVRVAAFIALALFAAAHWLAFLVERRGAGILIAVASAGLVATALGLSATPPAERALERLRPRLRRPAAVVARGAVVLAGLGAGAVAVGLPERYLRPRRWDDLLMSVDRALPAVYRAQWPYDGGEQWVALTVLLAVPAVVTASAALAFWPGRLAGARRMAALALLVALYGVAITERPLGEDLLRGSVLLALVGAWLWLPRLERRDAGGAAIAVLAAGAVAVVLGSSMRDRPAWLDYESWSIWDRGGSAEFEWTHSYGPIAWPRDGTTLLYVKARRGHYWKVQSLDGFDGLRWYHSGARDRSSPGLDIPSEPFSRQRRRRWVRRLDFTVASLRSEWVTTSGIPELVDTADRGIDPLITPSGVRTVGQPLRRGDAYRVQAYVPEPGAGEMREAPPPEDDWLRVYTRFVLPLPGQDAATDRRAPERDELLEGERVVTFPLPGEPTFGRSAAQNELDRRSAARRVQDSPYAEVYRLAKRLAAGTSSQYALVRKVERYLRDSGGFSYSEDPPESRYPLRDFVLRDKLGYCQQFSGAMALMLRMNGIPARVAVGFSPGSYNRDTGEFRVRDLDAHSWVEVWFEGLGWVAFDPTPPLAPARSQTADLRGADVTRGPGATGAGVDSRDPVPDLPGEEGMALEGGGGPRWWLVPLATVGAGLLGLVAVWLRAVALRRRAPAGTDTELLELEAALRRLGYAVPPGTTLLALEGRLARMGSPGAARYVRALRERRFAPGRGRAANAADRRELRRGLARGAGRLGRLRALVAIPPPALRAPRRPPPSTPPVLPR